MANYDTANVEITSSQAEATTRNSPLRDVFGEYFDAAAEFINENFPNVQPNHITKAGLYLTYLGAVSLNLLPDKPICRHLAVTFHTIGGSFDGLDGSLDKVKRRPTGAPPTIEGKITDAKADRKGETIDYASLAIKALRRGNRVGAGLYAAATITNGWGAMAKKKAESHGYIVKEGGAGTRVRRAVWAGIGMDFNNNELITDAVGACVTFENINTTFKRLAVIRYGDKAQHYMGMNNDPACKQEAKEIQEAVKPLALRSAAVGLGLGLGALVIGSRKSRKSQQR